MDQNKKERLNLLIDAVEKGIEGVAWDYSTYHSRKGNYIHCCAAGYTVFVFPDNWEFEENDRILSPYPALKVSKERSCLDVLPSLVGFYGLTLAETRSLFLDLNNSIKPSTWCKEARKCLK